MDRDFLVEEYKQLYQVMNIYHEAYTKLELFGFGGAIAAYGFLFTSQEKAPILAWWAIPCLIVLCAIRCFSYYFILDKKIAPYIGNIEKNLRQGSDLDGFQNMHTRTWPGRNTYILYNMCAWVLLIIVTAGIALWIGH